jgi:hypothetical protein
MMLRYQDQRRVGVSNCGIVQGEGTGLWRTRTSAQEEPGNPTIDT